MTWLIVAWWHLPGREVPAKSLALNLTMVPMWFKPVASWVWYVDGAYWSLKEEFLFYLVIGATLAFGLRRHAIWVVSALAALHLVGADSSLTLAQRLGWNDQLGLYMSFNLRWFSLFAIGMALYEMIATGFRVWRHLPVLLIAFADVIPLYQYAPGIFQRDRGLTIGSTLRPSALPCLR